MSKSFIKSYSEAVICLQFNGCLSAIFLLEMTAGILAFVYKDWVSKRSRT